MIRKFVIPLKLPVDSNDHCGNTVRILDEQSPQHTQHFEEFMPQPPPVFLFPAPVTIYQVKGIIKHLRRPLQRETISLPPPADDTHFCNDSIWRGRVLSTSGCYNSSCTWRVELPCYWLTLSLYPSFLNSAKFPWEKYANHLFQEC